MLHSACDAQRQVYGSRAFFYAQILIFRLICLPFSLSPGLETDSICCTPHGTSLSHALTQRWVCGRHTLIFWVFICRLICLPFSPSPGLGVFPFAASMILVRQGRQWKFYHKELLLNSTGCRLCWCFILSSYRRLRRALATGHKLVQLVTGSERNIFSYLAITGLAIFIERNDQ